MHSVFTNSCNVLCGGELLTLHRFTFGMLPRSFLVPDLDTRGIAPGDPVRCGPEGGYLGRQRLEWAEEVTRFDTRIRPAAKRPRYWKEIRALLEEKQGTLGGDSITALIYTRLRQAIQALWIGLNAGDGEEILRQCRCCIGLGQGLTPSGDDMLLGTLAALEMYRPELARRLAEGVRPLLDQTNDISRSYLSLALEGYAATPVLRAAAELSEGGSEGAKVLLTVGHSSGCDILEGLVTAAAELEKNSAQ